MNPEIWDSDDGSTSDSSDLPDLVSSDEVSHYERVELAIFFLIKVLFI